LTIQDSLKTGAAGIFFSSTFFLYQKLEVAITVVYSLQKDVDKPLLRVGQGAAWALASDRQTQSLFDQISSLKSEEEEEEEEEEQEEEEEEEEEEEPPQPGFGILQIQFQAPAG
jgi:ribosomal protein L12E/L44/L45/RPP1/RPP2